MSYNIVQTTAEDIISVVDAVLAKNEVCDKKFVSEFSDISIPQAENALKMAVEMGLIQEKETDIFSSSSHLASLIVSARNSNTKASLLRLVFEQYEPYVAFKTRFLYTGSLDTAAKQIRTLYSMTAGYKEIKNTIINIATYAKAMINDGAGSYKLDEDNVTYIEILDLALKFKANDDGALQEQLGPDVYEYIDKKNVFAPLSDAYSKIQALPTEIKPIILYAGNAFESFLQQIATDNGVSLSGKSGIIQKSQALNSIISKKHRGMIEYIGQVRNAADHGVDADENGQTWSISEDTCFAYPILVTTVIKDIYYYQHGKIVV